MKTLSPRASIVSSPQSIHKTSTHLELIIFNNNHFKELKAALPSNIVELTIAGANEKTPLPSDLTRLVITPPFKRSIGRIPPKITHLTLDNYAWGNGDGYPSVTHLTIGNSIDSLSLLIFPPNLTHLTLGKSFNMHLYDLPPTLTHLTTNHFDLPFNDFPPTLKYLATGEHFNQHHCIPTNISYHPYGDLNAIDFGEFLELSLMDLPASLKILTLNLNAPIDCLPSSLAHSLNTRR